MTCVAQPFHSDVITSRNPGKRAQTMTSLARETYLGVCSDVKSGDSRKFSPAGISGVMKAKLIKDGGQ